MANEEPGKPEGMEGMTPEMQKLERILYQARAVSKHVKEGDYMSAAFMIDNFPEGYNKDALYAGMAVALAGEIDKTEDGKGEKGLMQAQVLRQLMDYCRDNCSYFNKDANPAGQEG